MKHHIVDIAWTVLGLLLLFDNWRLRRRLRVDRIAQEAEDALGPPHIGDIPMPAPSDPRWSHKITTFSDGKHRCLVLGRILVREDIVQVYIGDGDYVSDGRAYAKRVISAYKRRLVEESMGSS